MGVEKGISLQDSIGQALSGLAKAPLRQGVAGLLAAMGYQSGRIVDLAGAPDFWRQFIARQDIAADPAWLRERWLDAQVVHQFAPGEAGDGFDAERATSLLFLAVELGGDAASRKEAAALCRLMSRAFPMPIVLFVKHAGGLSVAVSHRRGSKVDSDRWVISPRASVLDSIRLVVANPKHLSILEGLEFQSLKARGCRTFDELHDRWETALDDDVVTASEQAVKAAADVLLDALPPPLIRRICKLMRQQQAQHGMRTTCLLWLNAILTQQHIHEGGLYAGRVERVRFDEKPTAAGVLRDWQAVLKINWYDIFNLACESLAKAGDDAPHAVGKALRLLLHAAAEVTTTRQGRHMQLSAGLFPKLAEDREETAAFYTQESTARMLARIAIREEDRDDWAGHGLLSRLQIADLACGTGTLLRNAYRRVRALHDEASGGSPCPRLHQDAMSKALVGLDISPVATHMTSASLAAVGDGLAYDESRIGWTPVGMMGDARQGAANPVSIGSLDLLGSAKVKSRMGRGITSKSMKQGPLLESQKTLFGDIAGTRSRGKRKLGAGEYIHVPDRSLDYILMNPPYSGSSGGKGTFHIANLTESEQDACRKQWEKLRKRGAAHGQAGMAASFLDLAELKVASGGRIGFVLPATMVAGYSWTSTRAMIERCFQDVVVVAFATHDAMSADTNMKEIMLLATHRAELLPEKAATTVLCATLERPPKDGDEAEQWGGCIMDACQQASAAGERTPVCAGGRRLGWVNPWPASNGAPWSAVGELSPTVTIAAALMAQGIVQTNAGAAKFDCNMAEMQKVFEVGPTNHLIGRTTASRKPIGAYTLHDLIPPTSPPPTSQRPYSLWKADAAAQGSLLVAPTHYGVSRGAPAACAKVLNKQGRMHYAMGMRWTSQALLVAATEQPVLGGRAWLSLLHADEAMLSALSLWANSTMGLMVQWTHGSRPYKGRTGMSVGAIKGVPCPHFDQLSDARLAAAQTAFDELKHLPLRPACEAHCDPMRRRIDEAAVAMLFPQALRPQVMKRLDDLRLQWCSEPSVHGRK